jgi:hypothetical protein
MWRSDELQGGITIVTAVVLLIFGTSNGTFSTTGFGAKYPFYRLSFWNCGVSEPEVRNQYSGASFHASAISSLKVVRHGWVYLQL